MAFNFDAEEVWNGRFFSTQVKYTKTDVVLVTVLENYFRESDYERCLCQHRESYQAL